MTGELCVTQFTLQSQKHLTIKGSVTKTGWIPTRLKYSHFFIQHSSPTLKATFVSVKSREHSMPSAAWRTPRAFIKPSKPRKWGVAPVWSVDGFTHKDRHEIPGRWANHFKILLNHANPGKNILDQLTDLPPNACLNTALHQSKICRAIKSYKNSKSAGSMGYLLGSLNMEATSSHSTSTTWPYTSRHIRSSHRTGKTST